MRKFVLGATALLLLAASPAPADEGVTPMLKMNATYNFVLGSAFKPMAPFVERSPLTEWALVWEGTIQGDVNGAMRWWVPFTAPDTFTGVARWEIWGCEPEYPSPFCDYDDPELLIMAGYESWAYVSETDWEGKGVVTYANEQYAEWFGRRITDGGWVDFSGLPYGGGLFTIYNRPSNKH